MKRPQAILSCTAAALSALLCLSSCGGLLQGAKSDALASKPLSAKAQASRLAQLDHGKDAYFAQCAEPLCPAPTPKILAVAFAVENTVALVSSARLQAPETFDPHHKPRTAEALMVRKAQVLVLLFATDSAKLTLAHKAQLSNAAAALSHAERILILGRTDNVGPAGPNEAIALTRAFAVREHLKRLLTHLPDDIRIDARGLCCYAGTNDSAEGRARNRRVELVFTEPLEVKP
jgi:outer membrane protein OmpA-like peptidoglycan-associated protein